MSDAAREPVPGSGSTPKGVGPAGTGVRWAVPEPVPEPSGTGTQGATARPPLPARATGQQGAGRVASEHQWDAFVGARRDAAPAFVLDAPVGGEPVRVPARFEARRLGQAGAVSSEGSTAQLLRAVALVLRRSWHPRGFGRAFRFSRASDGPVAARQDRGSKRKKDNTGQGRSVTRCPVASIAASVPGTEPARARTSIRLATMLASSPSSSARSDRCQLPARSCPQNAFQRRDGRSGHPGPSNASTGLVRAAASTVVDVHPMLHPVRGRAFHGASATRGHPLPQRMPQRATVLVAVGFAGGRSS